MTTLDIGAGIIRKADVTFDINPKNSPTVCGDMHRMPFVDMVFDKVVMSHVLEHTHRTLTVLAEVNRILKSNGLLEITVPNFAGFATLIHWFRQEDMSRLIGGHRDKHDAHHKLFTLPILREELETCGFKIVDVTGVMFGRKKYLLKFLKSRYDDMTVSAVKIRKVPK